MSAIAHANTPVLERFSVATGKQESPDDAYQRLLQKLCDASVKKRFEAFTDIDWEHPDMAVSPEDPRWELDAQGSSLGATDWYQRQPAAVRSRIGLHMMVSFCYVGRVFEGILSRGLLRFAATQPHGSLEYRFAYHEVIEEGHHSLMFQELVNRSKLHVPLLSKEFFDGAGRVAEYGSSFPEMLFIYALGGEEPIDFVQRAAIAKGMDRHPLADRISKIHITEEARHVAFARAYLRRNVPNLDAAQRHRMSIEAPVVLGAIAKTMMDPPANIIATYQIPDETVEEAFVTSPDHRGKVVGSMAGLYALCGELGLLNDESRALWTEGGLVAT